jgi:hypothetical protein
MAAPNAWREAVIDEHVRAEHITYGTGWCPSK